MKKGPFRTPGVFAVSSTVTGLRNGLNYTSCFSGATIFGNGNRVANFVPRAAIGNIDSSQVSVSEGGCGASGIARQRDGDT